MKIQLLGYEVKDKVTGYVGTAVAKTEWLNGCIRWTLQGKVDKDGKVPDTYTFDEPQLELVSGGITIGKIDVEVTRI